MRTCNIHRAGNPFGRARLCCLFWLMQNQSGDSNAPDCCTARRNSRGLQDELIAQRSLAGVVARALASSTRLPSRVRPRPLATCRATRRVGGRRTRSNSCCDTGAARAIGAALRARWRPCCACARKSGPSTATTRSATCARRPSHSSTGATTAASAPSSSAKHARPTPWPRRARARYALPPEAPSATPDHCAPTTMRVAAPFASPFSRAREARPCERPCERAPVSPPRSPCPPPALSPPMLGSP